eukprot:364821-Chlamydomonas_euryale.AAC.3
MLYRPTGHSRPRAASTYWARIDTGCCHTSVACVVLTCHTNVRHAERVQTQCNLCCSSQGPPAGKWEGPHLPHSGKAYLLLLGDAGGGRRMGGHTKEMRPPKATLAARLGPSSLSLDLPPSPPPLHLPAILHSKPTPKLCKAP